MSSREKWQQLFRLSLQKSCTSCRLYSRSARVIFSFRQTSGRAEGAIRCQCQLRRRQSEFDDWSGSAYKSPTQVFFFFLFFFFNCADGNSLRSESDVKNSVVCLLRNCWSVRSVKFGDSSWQSSEAVDQWVKPCANTYVKTKQCGLIELLSQWLFQPQLTVFIKIMWCDYVLPIVCWMDC